MSFGSLVFTIISCLCDMDESSSRSQQSFRRGKGMCYHFCSEIYGFREQRALKIRTIEPSGLFKGEDISVHVQELAESIENMNAKSLSDWLSKFVQVVENTSGGRYPSRTLYNIVYGLIIKRSFKTFI